MIPKTEFEKEVLERLQKLEMGIFGATKEQNYIKQYSLDEIKEDITFQIEMLKPEMAKDEIKGWFQQMQDQLSKLQYLTKEQQNELKEHILDAMKNHKDEQVRTELKKVVEILEND